jgi:L-serine dehydratase
MEECAQFFDMLKIGVGPSSSHTRTLARCRKILSELRTENLLRQVENISVNLYGSLSL